MNQEKQTYYIDVASGEILQNPAESSPSFKLYATPAEIDQLKSYYSENSSADFQTFQRAQVPFREYHHDAENKAYDDSMRKIYGMIYLLGDEEAKRHIDENGILKDNHSDNPEHVENFK
ncbi:hydrolase [Metabacillus indicus]|uniref:hydrolase n=1 Tax=Metabacillus indicus TaxID=246786 RepID=UPI00317D1159